jgi:hypothetical protein
LTNSVSSSISLRLSSPEAQVGVIFAEAAHRLGVRHPGPGAGQQALLGDDLGHHTGEHAFDQAHDVLPLDERHFQVELGELRLAVAALVFIPETAGDLEITLDPGHHQQLLELLGRLGQGVELAGVHA